MRLRWSIIDLRRTSVGCAVSTGAISAVSSSAATCSLPIPSLRQPLDRRGDVRARLGGDALAVLGEIGEHREQHEPAHEIERLVERQPVEPEIDLAPHAAMPIDRRRADIFGAPEQLVAAIGADHVAEQLAEKADVGIVGDRGKLGHGAMLHRSKAVVNTP